MKNDDPVRRPFNTQRRRGGASDLRDFLVFSHYAALSKKVLIHLDVGGGIVEGVNEQILHLETVNGTERVGDMHERRGSWNGINLIKNAICNSGRPGRRLPTRREGRRIMIQKRSGRDTSSDFGSPNKREWWWSWPRNTNTGAEGAARLGTWCGRDLGKNSTAGLRSPKLDTN